MFLFFLILWPCVSATAGFVLPSFFTSISRTPLYILSKSGEMRYVWFPRGRIYKRKGKPKTKRKTTPKTGSGFYDFSRGYRLLIRLSFPSHNPLICLKIYPMGLVTISNSKDERFQTGRKKRRKKLTPHMRRRWCLYCSMCVVLVIFYSVLFC